MMLKNQGSQVKESSISIGGITYLLVLGFLGYITGSTTITGGLSPINVSIVACANFMGGIATFAASLIAYFFNGTAAEASPQICSMIVILGVRFIISEVWQKKVTAQQSTLISTFTMMFFGVGLLLMSNFTLTMLFFRFAQAILCGCTAYFIRVSVSSIKKNKVIPIAGVEGAALGVIYVLLLATLSSLEFSNFNIGRAFGVLVMLLAIKKYRYLGGAVCGVLTSCGVILCSPQLGKSTMLLACAGLIAGLFAELGSLGIIVTFIAANTVGLITIGVTQDTFPMLVDIAIATSVFVILPSSLWLQALQSVGRTKLAGEAIAQNASERLNFASKTINDVKESINKVSVVMERKNVEKDLSTRVCESVCGKCKNNLICWEQNYDQFNNGFNKIEKMIRLKGKVSYSEFPVELSACVKKNLLEQGFNEMYNEINYQYKSNQKLKEMRTMLSDQFSAMEEMLSSLSLQLSCYGNSDQILSKKVTSYFFKHGITNSKVCVFNNNFGSLTVEVFVPRTIKFNDIELCIDISDIVEKEMEVPKYSTVNGLTRIELWEKPQYSVDSGASQIAGSTSEITGDSYELFLDNQAEAFIVLSDGMGSGKRAQLDSLLTSSLISRLIRAGIGYSSAIRLMNSSMKVKSWEESFATVDIAIINLYEGTLDVVKAGASATYLVRGTQLKQIEGVSMPIGILQEVKPAKMHLKLKSNDIVITASDGLLEESLEEIKQIAIENIDLPANEISKKMIECAKQSTGNFRGDDITIIVSKVIKNTTA